MANTKNGKANTKADKKVKTGARKKTSTIASKSKSSLMSKAKKTTSKGKKSASKKAQTNSTPAFEPAQKSTVNWAKSDDPAHSPGHRHMNHKNQADNISLKPDIVRAQKVAPMNRRIITGAAVGKTGARK